MTSHWDAETCLWLFQLRSIRSNPRDLNLGCWEEWESRRTTRLVLAASENIYRIFNVYDLYRKSSSAFGRIVGLLTLTIDANFRNDCPGSSEISTWALLTMRESSRCVLLSDSSSLAYWKLRWTVLKPYLLPKHHKRLISGIQRTVLFPLL